VAAFDVLMVVALGMLAGALLGLGIGFLARRQQPLWAEMSRREKLINIALVLFCSFVCTAGLAWYALT
jgi:NhaP-type Na+/H+ or K+/H+ antiporter